MPCQGSAGSAAGVSSAVRCHMPVIKRLQDLPMDEREHGHGLGIKQGCTLIDQASRLGEIATPHAVEQDCADDLQADARVGECLDERYSPLREPLEQGVIRLAQQ